MTNDLVAATLYKDTCKLAYTVSRMAISPRLPFTAADGDKLIERSDELATCAYRLRQADSDELDSSQLENCLADVKACQALFDIINNTNGEKPEPKVLFAAIDRAAAEYLV